MAGTGAGLAVYNQMRSGRPYLHLYWNSELVLGGTGPVRGGLKLFRWYQNGESEFAVGKAQLE